MFISDGCVCIFIALKLRNPSYLETELDSILN